MKKINLFLPYSGNANQQSAELQQISQIPIIDKVFLLHNHKIPTIEGKYTYLRTDLLHSSRTFRVIEKNAQSKYILLKLDNSDMLWDYSYIERFVQVAQQSQAGICYSDYYEIVDGKFIEKRLIDYQRGSLRDNFNFGHLVLFNTKLFKATVLKQGYAKYLHAGFYDTRLKMSLKYPIKYISEPLYTVMANAFRPQSHFSYLDPNNRRKEIEMEKACISYLKCIKACLPHSRRRIPLMKKGYFVYEASVIIPVRNRVQTIKEAIESALSQRPNFPFNIIVVDNHSDDGTTEMIQQYAHDKRIIHLIPTRKDLNIGGCWNLALQNPECGKFAIQLDSDDLYSSPQALQIIVEAFYKQQCGMLIGAYRLTDFNLNEIPPGIIDHREWTPQNGGNNALRVNGLGAPRAFYTPLIRQFEFPNTSYGEDYAVGLRFARERLIGRVYDILYICRRWKGNSDAALSMEKANEYNYYKDTLRSLELDARINYIRKLKNRSPKEKTVSQPGYLPPPLKKREIEVLLDMQRKEWPLAEKNYFIAENKTEERLTQLFGFFTIRMLHIPHRIHSARASTHKKQKCPLCAENRPNKQIGILFKERYSILCNPYPVFDKHFVIADCSHVPQKIDGRLEDMLDLAEALEEYAVFYNGADAGASIPGHFHFQAVETQQLPFCKRNILKRFIGNHNYKPLYFFDNNKELIINQVYKTIRTLSGCEESETEPAFNLLCWYNNFRIKRNNRWNIALFPRKRHRPKEYYKKKEECILISPGTLEMAGVFVFPRKEDFVKVKHKDVLNIYEQL